jgi:hypothetical protein
MNSLLALLALLAVGYDQNELQKNLQARMLNGELGQPPCAPVTGNARPVEQGFDDIRFEAIPGAHRVVFVPRTSGWRMVDGLPELTLFTAAGFYESREASFTGSDGNVRPPREFRLTRKGYEAMAGSAPNCFAYRAFRSVEVTTVKEIEVPPRLSGMGKAYLVMYKLNFSEPVAWANTPEFRYVFNKIYAIDRVTAGSIQGHQTFYYDGRWLSEREAMMALSLDAMAVSQPQYREQAARQRDKLLGDTPEAKAARSAALTPALLRARLNEEKYRAQLAPCLMLPLHESDATSGFWKKDAPPALALYDGRQRPDRTRYDHALEMLRRLEKAGVVRSERFEGTPFVGAPSGAGTRYLLSETAAAALLPSPSGCLPLGEAQIESLRAFPAPNAGGMAFRGWARLAGARAWTDTLSKQFPHVRAMIANGYGVSGLVPPDESQPMQVQVAAPAFGLKPTPRQPYLEAPVVTAGPSVVDELPGGAVRMRLQGCKISDDGTEVSAGTVSCSGGARATRGFRGGKAYAEITFRGKQKGANPDTWTNAAVTSKRALSSVSTGAALFSFAGSFTKQQIHDGDLIGFALDMDERVLYWHVNGNWMTGRPGSGIGEPMIDAGEEYFIAVSVQNPTEAWRVNFGATPFRFPPPQGFPAYGAPRKL